MLAGRSAASVEVIGVGPIMYRPGAATSGFANPSSVYPYDDQGAAVSSLVETEPLTSSAPTVNTNGSLPGAPMVP